MSSSVGPLPGRTASRFCDYFVIFGLDENSGLEVLQSYEEDQPADSSNWTPLEKSYKPRILAHYPDTVAWNPFDHEAVRSLCLPSGLIFRTQKHILDPSFHSFVITRENGTHVYGCSYVFYEEVKCEHVISAIQTLQAMHLTELSSAKHYHEKRATQSRNIRNNGGILQSNQRNLHRKNHLPSSDDSNTRSLPRHFKIGGGKGSSLASIQNFYDVGKDRLYVTKGIALISHLPFVHAPKIFLSRLHNLWESGTGNLSLESHVHNLLYEVPLPPPGRSLEYNCIGEKIILSRPGATELPLLDYFLGDLFKLLDPQSLIQLFTCLLLENQILLYSKDLYRLMVVSECVTSLLFPFVWQHVYVPILPSTLFHFLDAPVPYIMGLHAQTTECGESLPAEGNLCFVDIDRNQIQIPEDTPTFPQKNDLIYEILSLLKEYKIQIRKSNRCERNNVFGSLRGRRNRGRKASHGSSADSDSGMSSNEESLNGSSGNIALSMTQSIHSQLPIPYSSYQSVQNTDADVDLGEEINEENFLRNLKINNGIREIFFNRFIHIFSTYDHFVVSPDQDSSRIYVHNFDKATFLSDQPDENLPFLSRFLETQMFASLIDRKIATLNGETDLNLTIFEERIKILRSKFGESLVRTPVYEPCPTIRETEEIIEKRFFNRDFIVPFPKAFNSAEEKIPSETPLGSFPILSKKLLNILPPQSKSRRMFNELSGCNFTLASDVSVSTHNTSGDYPSLRSVFVPSETNSSPASIAQANWEFVKQLLQECKNKTKRMLVDKLGGEEALALGHGGDFCVLGLEEKTLVASLCDLLERIWAHGLHVKQKGKSPLWNFLMNYEEAEAAKDTSKPIDPQFLSPDLSARAMELNLNVTPYKNPTPPDSPRRHVSRSRDKAMELPILKPLPNSIASDIRNIQGISEIRTEIGYARAWIRLSLEKKVLSKNLRCLLSDDELLRGFYKRTAFLRSEEEREQFLYHLLTLNAVDYFSFTNTYTNILLPYRVWIFPARRQRSTANLWITLSGTLGETGIIHMPKNILEHAFMHKNIGRLRSLRIGHDNAGVSPRILVEYVVVRNEVTGHTKKFPCGRWLGRDVDDGSTERLLVGECMEINEENAKPKTPPRVRSPSVPRRFYESRLSVRDIQKNLVESVDRILKYYSIGDKDKGSLTVLLCGEFGLAACLEHVFQYGFKSSRLFTRNFYIWDFLLRVKEYFESELEAEVHALDNLGDKEEYYPEQVETVKAYVELIEKIQSVGHGLGKDGKLQLFVCLSARDHLLHRIPVHLSSCPSTMEMFDVDSFLRDPHLLSDLIQTLEPLDDLDITLEQSLSKGIE